MRLLLVHTAKARHLLLASCASLLLFLIAGSRLQAQTGLMLNLSPLDGVVLTPDNLFGFALQSNMPAATEAVVKGSMRYREGGHYFTYTFRTTVRPGLNRFEGVSLRPEWNFSGAAFRELFQEYHLLPQGTYEYCISITPTGSNGELIPGEKVDECLYGKSEDLFLINLVDPENGAKLHEHYPVFSWIANYPFASQLTYRIRVAEIKEGQNTVNAVVRNNPVYTESNLPQTTTTYPVYGTLLKRFQPYAWTVDAYYKGILLGGAESWKFTIVEDSEMVGIPRESSFVDIRKEQNAATYWAVGDARLKYTLEDRSELKLHISVLDQSGNTVHVKDAALEARFGDNRYIIDLKNRAKLKHLKRYTLVINSEVGETFHLNLKYVDPDLL